ncbi:hypothetical protein [Floridanema aerugineum]|uniref:Uncharacterized protein n=1 Tax=Floridaenema aerugineum BLCC-F46 TaxID=3153654 RepID=A0ABV4XGQ5_9CYAN
MYRSLKTISMIAITITTMGVMPSYGLQSRASSNATTSFSNFPASYSQKNQNISSTLLASDQCSSSLGETISTRAVDMVYGRGATFFTDISLPVWKNASYVQRCRIGVAICNSYNGSDFVKIVVRELGGTISLRNTRDTQEAAAIIIASMQTLCPPRYSEFVRDLQRTLSQ